MQGDQEFFLSFYLPFSDTSDRLEARLVLTNASEIVFFLFTAKSRILFTFFSRLFLRQNFCLLTSYFDCLFICQTN